MILYECAADTKWHGHSADCSSRNMPEHLRGCRGSAIVVAWAVGGEVNGFMPFVVCTFKINYQL